MFRTVGQKHPGNPSEVALAEELKLPPAVREGGREGRLERIFTPGKSGLLRPVRARSTARFATHNIVKPSNRKML